MFNANFPPGLPTAGFAAPSAFSSPMAGLGSTGFGASAMPPVFSQALNTLSMAVMGLMTLMMSQQVAMLGGSVFGGGAGPSLGSPLGGFLGGLAGAGTGAGVAGNAPGAQATKSHGKRIPGGKSLYKEGRGMFHKGAPGAPNTYAFENSPAGIAFAAKHNYASIDIDMQITKDGVPVATHWAKPLAKDGFYDPLGKIGKNTKVSDMTLAEVQRLRNKDGQSRIYPVATMVKELKKHGIAGDFEAKNDPRFATDKVMGYLADLVRDAGIKANLKSIHRGPGTDRILEKAQDHGFWVRLALAKEGQRKYLGYGD